MRLKMRSPYKSPSKAMAQRHQSIAAYDQVRRSPRRLKDSKLLMDGDEPRKMTKTYLITDTPDHKQNSSIMTVRQERLRKRFSLKHKISSLPVIPDTPVKKA